ncbi:TPA: NAD-dependent epimerase/dehydratase family protein [Candidatus Micrarchaeota archaeon]|nr:NAD-dependent epimerase/dehydratase family protein [Candidatus Micrarchaeota archaeon]
MAGTKIRVYVTGATGRLGKEVLKLLPTAIPLVREKSGLKNEMLTDFSESSLKGILKDATTIVHLAGSMNFLDPNELKAANVELTRRIVSTTPKSARIVFASSISVYGKLIRVVPADENSPTNLDSPYAATKLEAEKIILDSNTNSIILRIGTIYGPGFSDYNMILSQIKNGSMKIIGHGQNRVPFVHVMDVAKSIKGALDEKNAKPGVYVVCGESLKQQELLSIAAEFLGVSAPADFVPLDFALMFAQFEQSKAMLSKTKPKVTTEHILILASDRVFNSDKAKKSLGFNPRPLKDGIKEMVEEFVQL